MVCLLLRKHTYLLTLRISVILWLKQVLSSMKATLPPLEINCFILLQVLKKTFKATSKWLARLQELSSSSQQPQTEKSLKGNEATRVGTNSR